MEFFGGDLVPITSEIGFLKTDCEKAAQAFLKWQTPIQQARGVTFKTQRVRGNLRHALLRLEPLTSVERRRFLLAPTTGGWTAYFDNGWRGTDAMSAISTLAIQENCHGIRAVVVPDTKGSGNKEAKGRFGAVILEIYGPHQTDFLNYVRSVSVVNDGGTWSFDEQGDRLPFEDLSAYSRRAVRERFTPSMLSDYLKQLGISAFEDSFFSPVEVRGAILIEKVGPAAPSMQEYSIEAAREHF